METRFLKKTVTVLLRETKKTLSNLFFLGNYFSFYKDLNFYSGLPYEPFDLNPADLKPCVNDKTNFTPLDYTYLYQNTWCAKKIFAANPTKHYDIGSSVELVGTLAQFTPTVMVDIRPVDIILPDLEFVTGDLLSLPFRDASLGSVSCICVIEHVGLGRYGDKIDPKGSQKAITELIRVLAIKGDLYVSLPVDKKNKIYFNAHRAFTREYILELFSGLCLKEERYIYKKEMFETHHTEKGFGTGLYHFRKE